MACSALRTVGTRLQAPCACRTLPAARAASGATVAEVTSRAFEACCFPCRVLVSANWASRAMGVTRLCVGITHLPHCASSANAHTNCAVFSAGTVDAKCRAFRSAGIFSAGTVGAELFQCRSRCSSQCQTSAGFVPPRGASSAHEAGGCAEPPSSTFAARGPALVWLEHPARARPAVGLAFDVLVLPSLACFTVLTVRGVGKLAWWASIA